MKKCDDWFAKQDSKCTRVSSGRKGMLELMLERKM